MEKINISAVKNGNQMIKAKYIAFYIACILISIFLVSQFGSIAGIDQNSPSIIITDTGNIFINKVFSDNIKTVLVHKKGNEQSYPIIKLNSGEQIKLSFDDLHADIKNYQYTLIHCTPDWKKSEIKTFEYLKGYETDLIEESKSSFRTIIPYTHYEISFPNQYINITKSGNYIIKVFLQGDTADVTVFTHRFMVVKPVAKTDGKVKRGFPLERDGTITQKIEFLIKPKGLNIQNAFENLEVVVTQNRRNDNGIKGIKPTSVLPGEIRYEPIKEISFECGNEFRHFDTKDLRHQTEFISEIIRTHNGHNVILKPDKRKTFDTYITETDLNGRFLIRNATDMRNPATESDYVWVHFFLPYNNPIGFGDLYLTGQLTNWQCSPPGKLEYDFNKGGYTAELFLKQGYYEYAYLYKDHKSSKGNISFIEGNHYETNNEYMIYVYYKAPGTGYYQLIANKLLYSHP